jgi:hypothetical protein
MRADINDVGTITGDTAGAFKNGVIWSGILVLEIDTLGGTYSVANGIKDNRPRGWQSTNGTR